MVVASSLHLPIYLCTILSLIRFDHSQQGITYDSTTQQVLGRQVAMQNSNRDVRVRVQCDDNNNIELSKLRLISYCLTIDNYWPLVCRIINNRRNSQRPAQWEPPLCTGAAHKHNKSIIIISHHHHNHHLQCCLRLDTI